MTNWEASSVIFFFQAEDGIRDLTVTGVQTCALPISLQQAFAELGAAQCGYCTPGILLTAQALLADRPSPTRQEIKRSEEHTSELQSQSNLVCRLLLEKKKKQREKNQMRLLRMQGPAASN